ncbi:MAG: hypothetical protein ACLTSG_13650 [Lachnospiraceae bacterium]
MTIFIGVALANLIAPPIGAGGQRLRRPRSSSDATALQPFWMGIARIRAAWASR